MRFYGPSGFCNSRKSAGITKINSGHPLASIIKLILLISFDQQYKDEPLKTEMINPLSEYRNYSSVLVLK